MSSPNRGRKLVLSPRARGDFIDILRYTGETWGESQLHAYRDKINGALQLIGRQPALGHRAPGLPDTHRLCLDGSQVIVYRDQDTSVAVVRILHQRMSLAGHV